MLRPISFQSIKTIGIKEDPDRTAPYRFTKMNSFGVQQNHQNGAADYMKPRQMSGEKFGKNESESWHRETMTPSSNNVVQGVGRDLEKDSEEDFDQIERLRGAFKKKAKRMMAEYEKFNLRILKQAEASTCENLEPGYGERSTRGLHSSRQPRKATADASSALIKRTGSRPPVSKPMTTTSTNFRMKGAVQQPDGGRPANLLNVINMNNYVMEGGDQGQQGQAIQPSSKTLLGSGRVSMDKRINAMAMTNGFTQTTRMRSHGHKGFNSPHLENFIPVAGTVSKSEALLEGKGLMDNYRFERVLGTGSYATVRLALDKPRNCKVAIKSYEKYKLYDATRRKNVKREISTLSQLEHPNIIKLVTHIETPKQFNLVMEYVSDRSLYNYLKNKPNRRVSEQEAKQIFKQIVSGVEYCHARNMAHRDIKLENILLDDQNHVKIIDFGFAIVCGKDRLNVFCGTPSYMAPEICGKREYVGFPVDVWALGIVLYALLCGRFPFKGSDEKDLYRKIGKGIFEIPSEVSQPAKNLLNRILVLNPSDRLSSREILNDSWLSVQNKGGKLV